MNTPLITIVSGLPRSGTSLMMQMLHAGGMPVLADHHRPADESNPRGYFEYEAVKRLRQDTTWLPLASGHAVKIIHLLLRTLPMDGSFRYEIIFMRRPLDDVLASQQAMLQRQGRAAAEPSALQRIFQSQLSEIGTWLDSQAMVRVHNVDFPDLIADPQTVAEALQGFLQADLNLSAMIRSVIPSLCHISGNTSQG